MATTRPTGVAKTLLVIVSVMALLVGCVPRPESPMREVPDHGYGGIVVELGETFTDAFEHLTVSESESLTITNFELIDTPKEIELVEVLVAGGHREANYQWEPTFPPAEYDMGPLVPLIGAIMLPPGQQPGEMPGYVLIMGLRVTEPGKWVRGGYRIEYVVDGHTYVNEVVAQITICTPAAVDENDECVMEIPED